MIFYVPNLIGYVRLVFAIGIVVCHAFDRYQGAVIAYATSTVLGTELFGFPRSRTLTFSN